jgi:hypothetical protein
MQGEIHALFCRYKTAGGFEYVADLFIGPRSAALNIDADKGPTTPKFGTLPGDSGTLWLLEPTSPMKGAAASNGADSAFLPLAVEWGRNVFASSNKAPIQSYAFDSSVPSLRLARGRSRSRLEHRSARHMGRAWPFLDRDTYPYSTVE